MSEQPLENTIKRERRHHTLRRLAFFFLGIVLFYAPLALFTRLLVWATDSPLIADAHRICLRMPFEWLLQPWMYPTLFTSVFFLIGLVLLPAIALVFGPWFCGWLCPAGSFTEFLGKLVPPGLKINLNGKVNPAPIRYGVLVAMFLSPFLGGYICCTFCNFAMMQNVVSAAFGDPSGLRAWASFTFLTFVVWFFALGIFVEGGRGWCNFLCPAGAFQGFFHHLGRRLGFSRSIQIDAKLCASCGECVVACPALAITRIQTVNRHACNLCRDCIPACSKGAVSYRKD